MPPARSPSRVVPLLAAAVSWASATVTTKVALRGLAPLDLLAFELATGAAVVWAVLLSRGRPFLPARPRAWLLLGALEPALSFALFDFGLDRTGAADGALLVASESVFAVLLARALLGERVVRGAAVALAVGVVGAALVALGEHGRGASLAGDALVLGGALAAAGCGVGTRRFARDDDPLAATAVQLLAALVLTAPVIALGAVSHASHVDMAGTGVLAAALATGVLGTALPFMLFNFAIRDVTIAASAVITNLIPVLAAALAIVLLGEHLRPAQLAGGALVVLAALGAERAVRAPVP